MVVAYAFFALFLVCAAYALVRGGAPERLATLAMIAAVVGSLVAVRIDLKWNSLFVGVFIVDLLLLAVFIGLAMRANRIWTMAVAAFQLIQTAGHLVAAADLTTPYFAYWTSQLWSFPIVATLALGAWHHRRRLRIDGHDEPWSRSSSRAAAPPPPSRPTAY